MHLRCLYLRIEGPIDSYLRVHFAPRIWTPLRFLRRTREWQILSHSTGNKFPYFERSRFLWNSQ